MVSFGLPRHFYLLLYYGFALFYCYLYFVANKKTKKTPNISNKRNIVQNPNWQEAHQLAIYKA